MVQFPRFLEGFNRKSWQYHAGKMSVDVNGEERCTLLHFKNCFLGSWVHGAAPHCHHTSVFSASGNFQYP